MTIDLTKHVKIWIHPDGLIPIKIINRLLFQRKVRPQDRMTFFINQACMERSPEKMKRLKEKDIHIKIIELCLSEQLDDKLLITYFNQVMQRVHRTKNVFDSIYATDILRLMKVVQREGIYSDNDVLFLNLNSATEIMKKYLFGCYAHGIPDIHILAIDLNYSNEFYEGLITKIKQVCGDPPNPDDDVCAIPGLAFIPDNINLIAYGHLTFDATSGNVILGNDRFREDGEKKLYARGKDSLLEEAKLALKEGYIKEIQLSRL